MQVIEEPFEDAGEQDAKGYYDYYYSGVNYRFVFAGRELHARSYGPGEAHVLAFTARLGGERCLFEAIPYDIPEFREAALYLRDNVADTVSVLLPNGYTPVDFSQFPGLPPARADLVELIHCFQCRAAIPEEHDKCPKCGWSWE